jgi:formylglycine-generating enzyme required for sulfatase activity
MSLNPTIIDEIIDLLQPHMNTPREREMNVLKLFMGTGKEPPHIDYTGATYESCFWIVKALHDYGEIRPGQPALSELLEMFVDKYGVNKQARIREVQDIIQASTTPLQAQRPQKAKSDNIGIVPNTSAVAMWDRLTLAQAFIIGVAILSLTVFVVVLIMQANNAPRDPQVGQGTTPSPSSEGIATDSDAPTWTPAPTDAPTLTPEPSNTPQPLSPEELALQGVSSNAGWTPYTQTFNGVEMVLVPKGCFMMGSDDGGSDEKPVHEVCFDAPFWIDRYEVTNEQYGSTGCETYSSAPDEPRNCVDWYDAHDFCEGRDARLPTEAEWEYAARGPDSLTYPWGNDFIGENVVYGSNSNNHTANVGSRPAGASWVDAMDMSGNLWEWTNSFDEDYPYNADDGREQDTGDRTNVFRVLRGGSFYFDADAARAAYRYSDFPNSGDGGYGFRCARSFE